MGFKSPELRATRRLAERQNGKRNREDRRDVLTGGGDGRERPNFDEEGDDGSGPVSGPVAAALGGEQCGQGATYARLGQGLQGSASDL